MEFFAINAEWMTRKIRADWEVVKLWLGKGIWHKRP